MTYYIMCQMHACVSIPVIITREEKNNTCDKASEKGCVLILF